MESRSPPESVFLWIRFFFFFQAPPRGRSPNVQAPSSWNSSNPNMGQRLQMDSCSRRVRGGFHHIKNNMSNSHHQQPSSSSIPPQQLKSTDEVSDLLRTINRLIYAKDKSPAIRLIQSAYGTWMRAWNQVDRLSDYDLKTLIVSVTIIPSSENIEFPNITVCEAAVGSLLHFSDSRASSISNIEMVNIVYYFVKVSQFVWNYEDCCNAGTLLSSLYTIHCIHDIRIYGSYSYLTLFCILFVVLCVIATPSNPIFFI